MSTTDHDAPKPVRSDGTTIRSDAMARAMADAIAAGEYHRVPVKHLILSDAAKTALVWAGIENLQQIVDVSDEFLLGLHRFDPTLLDEVRAEQRRLIPPEGGPARR